MCECLRGRYTTMSHTENVCKLTDSAVAETICTVSRAHLIFLTCDWLSREVSCYLTFVLTIKPLCDTEGITGTFSMCTIIPEKK